jgi:hypothetical protein
VCGSDPDNPAEHRPATAHARQDSGTAPGENESPSMGDFSRRGDSSADPSCATAAHPVVTPRRQWLLVPVQRLPAPASAAGCCVDRRSSWCRWPDPAGRPRPPRADGRWWRWRHVDGHHRCAGWFTTPRRTPRPRTIAQVRGAVADCLPSRSGLRVAQFLANLWHALCARLWRCTRQRGDSPLLRLLSGMSRVCQWAPVLSSVASAATNRKIPATTSWTPNSMARTTTVRPGKGEDAGQ